MSKPNNRKPKDEIQGESQDKSQEDLRDESALEATGKRFLIFNVMPSWLVSFIVHIVLIIFLAVAYWTIPGKTTVGLEAGEATEDISAFEDLSFDSEETADSLEENTETEITNQSELTDAIDEIEVDNDVLDPSMSELLTDVVESSAVDADPNSMTGMLSGAAGKIAGRSSSQRMNLVRKNGGSEATENAVKLAMEWLQRHQLPNGSWNFDHRMGPNSTDRTSPNPGDFAKAPRAATAMALLVFLGAGQTHIEGDYKEVVDNGLAYLLQSGERTKYGLSFYEDQGALYNHGLVAIVLCEAYAMTDDVRFATACQETLRYIEYCQDPIGGGWRYEVKQAGDTSAVGWQIMALKSAHMCGLEVDPVTIRKARRFLNFVSTESGAFYGYTHPVEGEREKGRTSVGLLSQMYLGWTRDNPALKTGVRWLGDRGPQVGDWKLGQMEIAESEKTRYRCGMYYNYYATQVMHQYGGETWTKWNEEMKNFLVATQATEGPARGSWFFQDPNEGGYLHGGRLYATTMAAMTLEVYYRYLPLYDDEKTSEAEFDLD